jgi:hypothetical protein
MAKRSGRLPSTPKLGALPPRYSFALHRDERDRFTKCPRCHAHTRLRKVPLVIHVDHPAGPRLTILGKTCGLCLVCEMLLLSASPTLDLPLAQECRCFGGTDSV